MTHQIPESRIALNPVVIDDSKRGLPPQNDIPPDMDALLAWLKEQKLKEQSFANLPRGKKGSGTECNRHGHYMAEKAYRATIAKIENSRVNQRPHVPQGWDEV